jgi:2-polyprenyl-3-methyl-5-hydroxy-6-metoxy-1,4-benzoquinol methylase
MQTYPQPTVDDLANIYSKQYYRNDSLINPKSECIYGYSNYLAERNIKQQGYQNILKKISAYLENNKVADRRLVDIGCGYGYFLDSSIDYGFAPIGIEFSEHAIQCIKRRYAFPIYKSGISMRDLFGPNSVGTVVLFDTIEHLLNPFKTLEEIHETLAPGGVLTLSTMDATSFMSRLMGERLEDFRRVNEHLFFFDRHTITAILNDKGFQVMKVSSIGHTFQMGNLISRMSMMIPFFRHIQAIVERLHMQHIRVSLDPKTKIIVYAIKV